MLCPITANNSMDPESNILSAADQLKNRLVDLARYRDKKVFIQLYDHFAPRLKAHLMQKGVSEEMSEELVQETMLSVWKHCSTYNPDKATASTWIFRIARNLWIDRIRKEKPDRQTSLDSYPEESFTPENMQADADKVKKSFKALPQQQAQLIYKVYYEGKTHREIASEMDIPLGSVKSGLRLAFGKLRQCMGGEV